MAVEGTVQSGIRAPRELVFGSFGVSIYPSWTLRDVSTRPSSSPTPILSKRLRPYAYLTVSPAIFDVFAESNLRTKPTTERMLVEESAKAITRRTIDRRKASHRGRDAAAGSLGVASCPATRCERQPGFSLASEVPRRTPGRKAVWQTPACDFDRQHAEQQLRPRSRASIQRWVHGDQALKRDVASFWNRGCDGIAYRDRESGLMMGLPAGTRIWIAAGVTDLRRGFTGLSGMVQTALKENPFSGHVFVFRGRRGDLIKMLWWDGDGLCLFAKRLERGRFIWPQATSGTVALTPAQLSMLLEGIDWRRPVRSYDPQIAV